MSFSSALSIATSGLSAASSRAQTAAENISNANTDGYTRRVSVVAENRVGNDGAGVQILSVERAQADFLVSEQLRLGGEAAFASERADATTRLGQIIGEPGVDDGLFGAYTRLENSLRDAAATPESNILLAEVASAGSALASTFNAISESSEALRTEADTDIGRSVAIVNDALARLEDLNGLLGSSVTPAIQDERDRLVSTINQEIPVSVVNRDPTISLLTEGGVFLLTQTAHFVEYESAGIVGRTQTLGAPLSGLTVDGVDITPSGDGPQATRTGRVAALFDIRDNIVPDSQDQLDALAEDLVTRFSDTGVDPTVPAGVAGLFTDGISTSPTGDGVGIAGRLNLNSLVNPFDGGDPTLLRDGLGATSAGPTGSGVQLDRFVSALTESRTGPAGLNSVGAASAAEFAADLASAISFDELSRVNAATFAETRHDIAFDEQISALGVDTDQELQQLLLIEQAYSANARVIQTIDELINQLLSIV